MHEKTDITSGRYLSDVGSVRFASAHLEADRETLRRVKAKLGLP
jgi:hypothetical protein